MNTFSFYLFVIYLARWAEGRRVREGGGLCCVHASLK